MRSFWSEPFLWIHLAGLGMLPFCLGVCWLALTVGNPVLPTYLEVGLVAALGSFPVLWMQLTRPFDIFSVLFVSLKPENLTPDQRRILQLFKTDIHRALTFLVPVVLLGVLWLIYHLAQGGTTLLPTPLTWRPLGLAIAAIAFLASNLFLQVPISVVHVLARSEAQFSAVDPYPLEAIRQHFTIPGLRVNRILPTGNPTPANLSTLGQSEPAGDRNVSDSG